MTDFKKRLSEIKARAAAAINMKPSKTQTQFEHNLKVGKEFEKHARADIDWLVAEIERLNALLTQHTSNETEQKRYINRLEARLREARIEWHRCFSDLKDFAIFPLVDAEMAKLRQCLGKDKNERGHQDDKDTSRENDQG